MEHRGFLGHETTLHDTLMVYTRPNICQSQQNVKHPRVNPNVNYELWVIITYPCRLINYNQCSTLMGDADSRRGSACVGVRGIWELCAFYIQLHSKPKTSPKYYSMCLLHNTLYARHYMSITLYVFTVCLNYFFILQKQTRKHSYMMSMFYKKRFRDPF